MYEPEKAKKRHDLLLEIRLFLCYSLQRGGLRFRTVVGLHARGLGLAVAPVWISDRGLWGMSGFMERRRRRDSL
jgi:hypothetical protein